MPWTERTFSTWQSQSSRIAGSAVEFAAGCVAGGHASGDGVSVGVAFTLEFTNARSVLRRKFCPS